MEGMREAGSSRRLHCPRNNVRFAHPALPPSPAIFQKDEAWAPPATLPCNDSRILDKGELARELGLDAKYQVSEIPLQAIQCMHGIRTHYPLPGAQHWALGEGQG